MIRTFLLVFIFAGSVAQAAEIVKPRLLIIGIDGVPYSMVAALTNPELGDKRLFKNFKRPSAVISTFPSDSHVAWTGLLEPLNIPKPPSYEGRYFDIKKQKVVGGFSLIEHYHPWEKFFDWRLKGIITGAIAYGWPKIYSVKELRKSLEAFSQSGKEVFSIYILSTDGVGHIHGPEVLIHFLQELDKELTHYKKVHPDQAFYTVMLSDHGMAGSTTPLINTWPGIKDAFKKSSLHLSEKIEQENDVVLVPYGLLNSFQIYTPKGKEEQAAKIAMQVKGIDLCVFPQDSGWKVIGQNGQSLIKKYLDNKGQELWSYEPLEGDPLNYKDVLIALKKSSGNANAFPDNHWFAATKNHFYPDALYRMAHGFTIVENPASVICSNTPGYMYGATITDYTAKLTVGSIKWTHGALHKEASLGFMISDMPEWDAPDIVRFNQALLPFVSKISRK